MWNVGLDDSQAGIKTGRRNINSLRYADDITLMAERASWGGWKKTVKSELLSHVQLCNPMDCIVHGILQARILEWVAFLFSRGSSQPRDRPQVSYITGGFFTSWETREALYNLKILLSQQRPQELTGPFALALISFSLPTFSQEAGFPISFRIFHSLSWSKQSMALA